jgi:hypothetical protein
MKSGKCIEIINPYAWLPGHGENSVVLVLKGADLELIIKYDAKNCIESEKIIVFKNVCACYKTDFPGPHMLDIEYNEKSQVQLGSLVEYPSSEVATQWSMHYKNTRKIRHFEIIFLSENIRVIVFSVDVVMKT